MTVINTFTDWVNAKIRRQRESEVVVRREAEKVKLLPPDLAERIIEAADAERARVLARLDEIDRALDDLAGRITEARKVERGAALVVENPPLIHERLNGEMVEIPQRPTRIRGKAAIKAGQITRNLLNWKARLENERADRQRRLGEIRRVHACAKRGVVSGVLAIARGWGTDIPLLWRMLPPAQAVPSDRAGSPVTEAQAETLRRTRGRVRKKE